MLQNGLTHSLVTKFFSVQLSPAVREFHAAREERWEPGHGQVCANLMSSKAHQNNRSYVSSADLPLDLLCKNLAWWVVTWRTQRNHKTVKIGWGVGACSGQYSSEARRIAISAT